MEGKRKKGGTCLILGGLLLLAAALFLTGYNLLTNIEPERTRNTHLRSCWSGHRRRPPLQKRV